MYKIELTPYGFRISASGEMGLEEAEQMKSELIGVLSEKDGPFSLVIDIRQLVLFEPEVVKTIVDAHAACIRMSCERTAILVKSPIHKGQASQICFSASSKMCDRIIDASRVENWEEVAIGWAANGVEPTAALSGVSSPD